MGCRNQTPLGFIAKAIVLQKRSCLEHCATELSATAASHAIAFVEPRKGCVHDCGGEEAVLGSFIEATFERESVFGAKRNQPVDIESKCVAAVRSSIYSPLAQIVTILCQRQGEDARFFKYCKLPKDSFAPFSGFSGIKVINP